MFKSQLSNIWNSVLEDIKNKVSNPSFNTWFESTELIAYYDDYFIINTPNNFVKEWLENNYLELINSSLEALLESKVKLKLVVSQNNFEDLSQDQEKPAPRENPYFKNQLNPKYTFETFVIGNSNRFAHAACLAVAESVGKAYNPLFIYGGVGLGKTHLMHAIGHYVMNNNPNVNVMYVSSERFTNELIDGIRDDKTANFRNKYRSIDVLLIDDIQFLAKKERTQEEFFHTFNALHEANKQIIISSDRTPKEINALEERLRTRFEWGLITDIQAPDLETRIAILRKKAQLENINVENEVITYIADRIKSNIRELEGALTRVVAYATLNNKQVDLDITKTALKELLSDNNEKPITSELIQQVVANYYTIKVDDLKAKKRSRSFSFPRQIAMFLCREMTDLSLPKIGEVFGGRDHSTVLHAYDKIKIEMKNDSSFKETISKIQEMIIKS